MIGTSPVRVKTKTTIGICSFSAKQAALRNKSKDWLTRISKHDNITTTLQCFLQQEYYTPVFPTTVVLHSSVSHNRSTTLQCFPQQEYYTPVFPTTGVLHSSVSYNKDWLTRISKHDNIIKEI
jgi:hypothetical protein